MSARLPFLAVVLSLGVATSAMADAPSGPRPPAAPASAPNAAKVSVALEHARGSELTVVAKGAAVAPQVRAFPSGLAIRYKADGVGTPTAFDATTRAEGAARITQYKSGIVIRTAPRAATLSSEPRAPELGELTPVFWRSAVEGQVKGEVPEVVAGAWQRAKAEQRDFLGPHYNAPAVARATIGGRTVYAIEARTADGIVTHVFDAAGKPIGTRAEPWSWSPVDASQARYRNGLRTWNLQGSAIATPAELRHAYETEPPSRYHTEDEPGVREAAAKVIPGLEGAEVRQHMGDPPSNFFVVTRADRVELYTNNGDRFASRPRVSTWKSAEPDAAR